MGCKINKSTILTVDFINFWIFLFCVPSPIATIFLDRKEHYLTQIYFSIFPKLMEINSSKTSSWKKIHQQALPCTFPWSKQSLVPFHFLSLSLLCSNAIGLGKGVYIPTLPIWCILSLKSQFYHFLVINWWNNAYINDLGWNQSNLKSWELS